MAAIKEEARDPDCYDTSTITTSNTQSDNSSSRKDVEGSLLTPRIVLVKVEDEEERRERESFLDDNESSLNGKAEVHTATTPSGEKDLANLKVKDEPPSSPIVKRIKWRPSVRTEYVYEREVTCSICLAESGTISGLVAHLDREHKIKVNYDPTVSDFKEGDEGLLEYAEEMEKVSQFLKKSGNRPRTLDPLPQTKRKKAISLQDETTSEEDSSELSVSDEDDSTEENEREYVKMRARELRRLQKIELIWEQRKISESTAALENYVQCFHCFLEYPRGDEWKVKRVFHASGHRFPKLYKICPHCLCPLKTQAQLEEHLEELQVPVIAEGTPPAEMNDLLFAEHKCPEAACDKTLATRRCLLWHRTAVHTPHAHRCPHCERPFIFYHQMRQHVESAHNWEKRVIQCSVPYCGKYFSTRKGIMFHNVHAHKKREDEEKISPPAGAVASNFFSKPMTVWRKRAELRELRYKFETKTCKPKENRSLDSASTTLPFPPSNKRFSRPRASQISSTSRFVQKLKLIKAEKESSSDEDEGSFEDTTFLNSSSAIKRRIEIYKGKKCVIENLAGVESIAPFPWVSASMKKRNAIAYGLFRHFCELCSRCFRKGSHKNSHILLVHKIDMRKEKPFRCHVNGCDLRSSKGQYLIRHLRLAHSIEDEEQLLQKGLAEDKAFIQKHDFPGNHGSLPAENDKPENEASESSEEEEEEATSEESDAEDMEVETPQTASKQGRQGISESEHSEEEKALPLTASKQGRRQSPLTVLLLKFRRGTELYCPECPVEQGAAKYTFSMTNVLGLQRHLNSHHPNSLILRNPNSVRVESIKEGQRRDDLEPGVFQVIEESGTADSDCLTVFSDPVSLSRHRMFLARFNVKKSYGGKVSACPDCGKEMSNTHVLQRHIFTLHQSSDWLKRTNTLDRNEWNYRRKSNPLPFGAALHGLFPLLSKHLTKDGRCSCPECGVVLSSKVVVSRHLREQHFGCNLVQRLLRKVVPVTQQEGRSRRKPANAKTEKKIMTLPKATNDSKGSTSKGGSSNLVKKKPFPTAPLEKNTLGFKGVQKVLRKYYRTSVKRWGCSESGCPKDFSLAKNCMRHIKTDHPNANIIKEWQNIYSNPNQPMSVCTMRGGTPSTKLASQPPRSPWSPTQPNLNYKIDYGTVKKEEDFSEDERTEDNLGQELSSTPQVSATLTQNNQDVNRHRRLQYKSKPARDKSFVDQMDLEMDSEEPSKKKIKLEKVLDGVEDLSLKLEEGNNERECEKMGADHFTFEECLEGKGKMLKCPICPFRHIERYHLGRHVFNQHPKSGLAKKIANAKVDCLLGLAPSKRRCPECRKIYKSPISLQAHFYKAHKKSIKIRAIIEEMKYSVEADSSDFEDEQVIKEPTKPLKISAKTAALEVDELGEDLELPQPNQNFEADSENDDDLELPPPFEDPPLTHNGNASVFKCGKCGIDFVTQGKYAKHVSKNRCQRGETFPCPKCGRTFGSEWNMTRHLQNNACHHPVGRKKSARPQVKKISRPFGFKRKLKGTFKRLGRPPKQKLPPNNGKHIALTNPTPVVDTDCADASDGELPPPGFEEDLPPRRILIPTKRKGFNGRKGTTDYSFIAQYKGKDGFSCPFCREILAHNYFFCRHLLLNHPGAELTNEVSNKRVPGLVGMERVKYKCDICDTVLACAYNLSVHYKKVHNRNILVDEVIDNLSLIAPEELGGFEGEFVPDCQPNSLGLELLPPELETTSSGCTSSETDKKTVGLERIKYKCSICKSVVTSAFYLSTHFKKAHNWNISVDDVLDNPALIAPEESEEQVKREFEAENPPEDSEGELPPPDFETTHSEVEGGEDKQAAISTKNDALRNNLSIVLKVSSPRRRSSTRSCREVVSSEDEQEGTQNSRRGKANKLLASLNFSDNTKKCPFCGKLQKYFTNFKQHIAWHERREREKLVVKVEKTCPICKQLIGPEKDIRLHIAWHKRRGDVSWSWTEDDKDEEENSSDDEEEAEICNNQEKLAESSCDEEETAENDNDTKVSFTTDDIKQEATNIIEETDEFEEPEKVFCEKTEEENKRLNCEVCKTAFPSSPLLKLHVLKEHTSSGLFKTLP